MSKLTHERLVDAMAHFRESLGTISTLISVLSTGGLNETATTDVVSKIDSCLSDLKWEYHDLWRYVDETVPSEKGDDNE